MAEAVGRVPVAAGPTSKAGSRDIVVDGIRGLCLVLMTINHLPANWMHRFTYQAFGFVGDREVFVLLSGLVAAWLYGAVWLRKGVEACLTRVLKAFARLYVVSMAITFAIVFATRWGGVRFADWRQLVSSADVGWGELAISLLTFRHTIAFLTLLRFYCLLLLLLPVILCVLKLRKERMLLLVSGAIWLLAQLTIAPRLNQFNPMWIPIIRVICWQPVYVLGALIGYRRCIGAPTLLPKSKILIGMCAAFAIFLFVERHQSSDPAAIVRAAGVAQWFWEDMTLGPMRLLNVVILIIPLSFVFSKMSSALDNFSPWRRLAYLGQHSIYIFAASLGTTYLGFLLRHQWAASGAIWQTAWVAAALSTLWGAGALHAWLRSLQPVQAVRGCYDVTLKTVRLIGALPRRQFFQQT